MIWTASGTRPSLGRRRSPLHLLRHPGALRACWGLVILWFCQCDRRSPRSGSFSGNLALGFSTLQALHVNRRLLPRELRPGWLQQAGTLCCGIFFLGVSIAVILLTFKPK